MIIAAITRISLTSADAESLAGFYEDGLGFTRIARRSVDAGSYGVAGARALVLVLALGDQQIELVQFDQPGAPYPQPCASNDPWFQHFAIVVRDIGAAFERLQSLGRSTLISRGGPVQLPRSSGGVAACKQRDPELHPFELLHFPSAQVQRGIDHSAIAVADTARSIEFYGNFGLSVSSRSLNQGPAQERLDDLDGVAAEVTGLSPTQDTPHLELLCYRKPRASPQQTIAANDIAATRLIVRASASLMPGHIVHDPDGHRLLAEPPDAQSYGFEPDIDPLSDPRQSDR